MVNYILGILAKDSLALMMTMMIIIMTMVMAMWFLGVTNGPYMRPLHGTNSAQ